MKRPIIVSVLAFLLTVGAVGAITLTADELKQMLGGETQLSGVVNPITQGRSNMTGEAFDLVGTRVGTTTTGRYWGTPSTGTSTFPVLLNPLADQGVFTIKPTNASSSAALLTFGLWSSNDPYCDTATTSSQTLNQPLVGEINWFDAGDLVLGATQDNPFTATSTITFPISNTNINRQIIVENLNSRCLALDVNGSSVAAWIQFKQNSKP